MSKKGVEKIKRCPKDAKCTNCHKLIRDVATKDGWLLLLTWFALPDKKGASFIPASFCDLECLIAYTDQARRMYPNIPDVEQCEYYYKRDHDKTMPSERIQKELKKKWRISGKEE